MLGALEQALRRIVAGLFVSLDGVVEADRCRSGITPDQTGRGRR
jgi:hypothetical protein